MREGGAACEYEGDRSAKPGNLAINALFPGAPVDGVIEERVLLRLPGKFTLIFGTMRGKLGFAVISPLPPGVEADATFVTAAGGGGGEPNAVPPLNESKPSQGCFACQSHVYASVASATP